MEPSDYYEDTKPFGILTLQTRQILNDPTLPNDPTLYFPATNTVNTEYGALSIGKTHAEFRNVNIKEVVGAEAWDKHTIFRLDTVQMYTVPFSGGQVEYSFWANPFASRQNYIRANMDVHMSGLPWSQSSYEQERSVHQRYAHLCCLSNYQDNDASTGGGLAGQGLFTHADIGFGVNFSVASHNSLYFSKSAHDRYTLVFDISANNLDVYQMDPNHSYLNNVFNIMYDWYARFHITAIR